MKTIKFFTLLIISLISFQFSQAQTLLQDSLKVNGNCGMCKKTIERNAMAAGATTANWDKKTKMLNISYDPSKSNSGVIENAVAASGYDTENKKASDKAYSGLDECCQYDRTAILKQPKKD